MDPRLDETVYMDFVTSASTGAAADADSTPTAEVFENATDTTVVALTVTKRTSKTGNYRVPVVCTTANGFEVGKSYNVVASATVGGEDAKAVIGRFIVRPVAAVSNVTQFNGVDAGTADGTATAGGASTITLATGVSFETDHLKDQIITLVDANDRLLQSRIITGNTNATPSVVTVHRPWSTIPDGTSRYIIDSTAAVRLGTGPTHDGHVILQDGSLVSAKLGVFQLAKTTHITGFNDIVAGAAMTLTTGERTAVANEVEAQIIDDTDSEKVLTAITDKIASVNPSLDDLTLGGIASAVRTELTVELARIDAAMSSRMATFVLPTNFGTLAINASGHVILQDGSLVTGKLGAFLLAKTTNVTGFNDLSAAQVNAQADIALADYDGPTKAEMDTALALLSTSAQLVKVLAAVYDSASVAGSVITLSNGATLTVTAGGRVRAGG